MPNPKLPVSENWRWPGSAEPVQVEGNPRTLAEFNQAVIDQLRRDRDELAAALETAHGEICRLMDEYGHVSGAMVARHCLDILARVKGR